MATTEKQSPSATADGATALYWKLDKLRVQLNEDAEQYFMDIGYADHEDVCDGLHALPDALSRASDSVARVQEPLAEMIVQLSGPPS